MGLITVERLQPGMVAATPVTDRRGRLLIPAELPLTDRHIQALQVWGVAHIEIEGEAEQEEAPCSMDAEEMERARATVDERFGPGNDGHPVIEALRNCAYQRVLRDGKQEATS